MTTKNTFRIALLSYGFWLVGCGDSAVEEIGVLGAETLYDETVTPTAVYMDACVPDGTGVVTGDQVANLTLQNCYGEEVELHDYCGRRTAMWLIGSAGWCGSCESYVPQAASVFEQRRHEGIELFVIVSEDRQYNAPTREYCMQYAAEKNIDPSRVLMDPGFSQTWALISPTGGSGGSVGLPWQSVLAPYDMTYTWNSQTDGGDAQSALNELLD